MLGMIKVWMARSVSLMLLLITWRETVHCGTLTVHPPQKLTVTDPGHLGHLEITWTPPAEMGTMTECSVQYQLEFFNTFKNSWVPIRTKNRMYQANFDLMKDVRVRVYTLLEGRCTNNIMTMSTNYTEIIQKPSNTGITDTQIQDFSCVFYNMEYTQCTWRRGSKTPSNSQQNLFFWHKGLDQAVECPRYITRGGNRTGCNFSEKPLPTFTQINFCVNGSSPEAPLKQTFISLEIQNHVKPAPAEKIYIQTGPNMQRKLCWEPASYCLEWEVEHNQEELHGQISTNHASTRETSLILPPFRLDERHCFRVRSKVHKYCADKSYWSDWSQQTCYPEDAGGHSGGTTEGFSPI